jgi:hypothetical protein
VQADNKYHNYDLYRFFRFKVRGLGFLTVFS